MDLIDLSDDDVATLPRDGERDSETQIRGAFDAYAAKFALLRITARGRF